MEDLYREAGVYWNPDAAPEHNPANLNHRNRCLTNLQSAFGKFAAAVLVVLKSTICTIFFIGWTLLLLGILLHGLWVTILGEVLMITGSVLLYYCIYKLAYHLASVFYGFDVEDSEDSETSQHVVDVEIPPRFNLHVIDVDTPPRYNSLPDLRPELFKATPPSYDDVCNQATSPPSYGSVAIVVPVHQPIEDRNMAIENV